MINLLLHKEHFSQHVATFTDYGNIKILDFKRPDSSEYRIRFLFEEDFYRLHISGDLGELIACNFTNMCWDKFGDFANNAEYFEEKVDCHSRPFYSYDDDLAREQLEEKLKDVIGGWAVLYGVTEEEALEDNISDIMDDFDDRTGIGSIGRKIASDIDPDYWEWIGDVGKERTGILELYLLAFRLAKAQLEGRK